MPSETTVLNCLTRAIAERCKRYRTEEKWLVAPSLRVGNQWLESVARSGQPAVNVRVKTIKSMAIQLAAPRMTADGLQLASPRASAFLVDQAVRSLRAKTLKYLAELDPSPRFAETALSSIESIRLAGADDSRMARECFEVKQKGDDLAKIVERYLALLKTERIADYCAVLKMAIRCVAESPPWARSAPIVLLPEDLTLAALEKQFLECIPDGIRQVLPVDAPAAPSESRPAQSDRELLRWLASPADAPKPQGDGTARLVRAVGEVNEVRAVLRECVAQGLPWDEVELLYTDSEAYVPLVYETLASIELAEETALDGLPVTFSEGLPCRYSRPGRALVAWLRWMADGFPQARLVAMIKEGLLALPTNEDDHCGFARLAELLRGIGIGFGRERYAVKISEAIHSVESRLQRIPSLDEADSEFSPARQEVLRRDLRALQVLRDLVLQLFETCPTTGALPEETLDGAQRFVTSLARNVSKLDRFAAESLAQEIADMRHWLSHAAEVRFDEHRWLESLPAETRVMGSGPRPGCLHVDSVFRGGHSGRRHTFIVGMDDGRFPGAGMQDPLLLDSERGHLSADIPTAAQQLQERTDGFVRLLARLRGSVTLSYSCRGVADDRDSFPSPAIVSAYRILSGNHDGTQEDLLAWLPPAVSFAPAEARKCVDAKEWWLWRLTTAEQLANAKEAVLGRFEHLRRGEHAAQHRQAAEFTGYDGYVPDAGLDLDPGSPAGRVMSSNALQTIGKCPREFFFRYGLDLAPPDGTVLDPDKWLDALAFGLLLHELFEQFVREIMAQGRAPCFHLDYDRLQQLLQEKIRQYQDLYPPPNDAAFRRQVAQLTRTARTFLQEEDHHCRRTGSMPAFLEASLGMPADGHGTPLDTPEPIPVTLPSGRVIRLRGRVDRIDRLGDGPAPRYGVWDYKSGSTWGYDRADPLRQGRKVQPFVYVTIVKHCLRKALSADASVQSFGFFFPGVKAVGERMEWTPKELADGAKVLDHLCQLVADGAFIATNDHKQDCGYCDYAPVCGDIEAVAESVRQKLEHVENKVLKPFRTLRSVE